MKILKTLTLTVAGICILYIMGRLALLDSELSFRMWVDASGKILTVLVLPLLLILLAGKCFYQVTEVKSIIKIFVGLAFTVAYAFWIVFAGLFISITIHTEHRLTEHLLVVNEAEVLEESFYVYYQPVAFLFRRPGELTNEIKVEYLEEKYDREFDIAERSVSRSEEERIYDVEYPAVRVAVYRSGTELDDNYAERLSQKYLAEGCEALGITREYYVAEDNMGRSGWIYMELAEESDLQAFAEDASGLIQYVMSRTDFFKEHRGALGFYSGEGEDKITGSLPFGKMSKWAQVQEDYYLDTEQVLDLVREKYEEAVDFRKDLEESRKKYEEQGAGSDSIGVGNSAGNGSQTGEVPEITNPLEDAAQAIYNAVLAEKGYSYEVKYYAKGNIYIDLGSRSAGEPEDKSNTGSYRFTLVYDRTSKNGNCELFVLYKEHYTDSANGGSTNDATEILDMYAVETATGKVIASGKQSWSDVGTKEYREATGE